MYWYVDGFFWRKTGPEWEKVDYGEEVDGKGDLIFNTCSRVIDEGDTSAWAWEAWDACGNLLRQGNRWPKRMIQDCDATTRMRWRWSQLCKWLYLIKMVKYRSRDSITRDPFVAWIMLTVRLHRENAAEYLLCTPIPRRLYTPSVWRWRRALIKGEPWSGKCRSKKKFVQRLHEYMEMAIDESRRVL